MVKIVKKNGVFKPTTRSRYLPGSVGLSIWKEDLKMYNRLRFNCFSAIPIVDTSPPKMNPHSYLKTKRLADDANRLIQIDKDNKDLLKKINHINRSKGYVDTFNPVAYKGSCTTKWQAHKKQMLKIQMYNENMYFRLTKTKPVYSNKQFEKEWKRNVEKMSHMAKYTLQMFLDKTVDRRVQEMPSISGGLHKSAERRLCYMDFRVKNGVYLGRIIIELYPDIVPNTVENFLALCKGYRGYSYKCSRVFNVVRGQYLEMGDVTANNGKGGISIFGDYFQEENHVLKHTKPGVLSMIRIGKTLNNSQFSITFDAQENLDGKRVVFGKVVRGMKTIYQIQDLGKKVGSPVVPIFVEKCAEFKKKRKMKK